VVIVVTTRRCCDSPGADRTVSALVEVQALPIAAVLPTRTALVDETLATCAPTTVTLVLPVAAVFVRTIELGTVASYDTAPLNVPTSPADVPVTTRLHQVPGATLDCTLDDDTHIVDIAVVDTSRPLRLSSNTPLFQPTTVTLCVPVIAAFVIFTLLSTAPSYVNIVVIVPGSWPDVNVTRCARPTPLVVLQATAESDDHIVDPISLPPDTPSLETALYGTMPASEPSTVTLCEPVDAVFHRTMLLATTPSYVNASTRLSACSITVPITAKPERTPAGTLVHTALALIHEVACIAVPLMRVTPLYRLGDTLAPTTVTD
jgi:hypothetical protein